MHRASIHPTDQTCIQAVGTTRAPWKPLLLGRDCVRSDLRAPADGDASTAQPPRVVPPRAQEILAPERRDQLDADRQPGRRLPDGQAEAGWPVGVQLVAALGREDLLLRVAAQLEAAAPWRHRRRTVLEITSHAVASEQQGFPGLSWFLRPGCMFDQSGGWKPKLCTKSFFGLARMFQNPHVFAWSTVRRKDRPIAAAVATVALVTVVAAGIGVIAWMI